jgi:DNA-binding MarR family transcriptional regulator
MQNGDDAKRFRDAMQKLLRSFGALAAETPCGQPLSIAHAHALHVLLRSDGDIDQKSLGEELGIDKSNVARLCARMAEMGHLNIGREVSDGRRRLLCLTEQGERVASAVDASSLRKFSAILRSIPEADRGGCLRLLGLLAAAFRADFQTKD